MRTLHGTLLAFTIGAMFHDELGLRLMTPILALTVLLATERASVFEVGLPVHGRTWLMSRTIATALLVLGPVTLLIVLAKRDSLSSISGLDALAIAALAILLPQCTRLRDRRGPLVWMTLLVWLVLGTGSFAMITLLPLGVRLIAFAATLAGGVSYVWRKTPAAMELATFEGAPTGSSAAMATRAKAAGRKSPRGDVAYLGSKSSPLVWWPLVRDAAPRFVLFSWALMALMGIIGDPSLYYALFVVSSFSQIRAQAQWSKSLPLSRDARLLMLLVPGPVMMLICFGIGANLHLPFQRNLQSMGVGAPSTSTADRYFGSATRVPLAFWYRATHDSAPVITAPWGEATAPYTLRIFGATMYNPYSSREENSERFVEWQFRKATGAVYGHTYSREEYEGQPTPWRLTTSVRMQMLQGSALLTFGILLLLLFLLVQPWSVARSRVLRWMAATLPMLPVFAILAFGIYHQFALEENVTAGVSQQLLLNLSAQLPRSAAAVGAVAALPITLSYLWLRWQVGRVQLALQ